MLVCAKRWHELLETEEDGIRFCQDCMRLIFHARTTAELRIAARRGFCVYMNPEVTAMHESEQRVMLFSAIIRQKIARTEVKALRRLREPAVGIPVITKKRGHHD